MTNNYDILLALENDLAEMVASGEIRDDDAAQVIFENACADAGTDIHAFRDWASENA